MRIALSGPQAQLKNVASALEDAGFSVMRDQFGDPIRDDYGLGDEVQPGSWLTVEGEHLPGVEDDATKGAGTRADKVAEPFGWRMRSQNDIGILETPSPAELTPEQKLARLGLTAADLKSILAVN